MSNLLEKNCSKKFKQIIAHFVKFSMELTKKTMLSSKKVALNTTSNKFLTIDLTMILIVLIRIQKYFVLLLNKKKILTTLQMKASHSFEKLDLALPKNPQ